MKNKSLIFVMSTAVMPIPLKKSQKFSISKIEINRRIGESIFYLSFESDNNVIARKPLFKGSYDEKANWAGYDPPFKVSMNQKNIQFEFEGFKRGDEIKIYYNLIK